VRFVLSKGYVRYQNGRRKMQICCTKKLLESISVTPEEHFNIDPLFSWHADVFTIDRRKTVVLVNDKNRYAVILYDLRAKDSKNFGSIFVEAIRRVLQEEDIKE